MKILARNQIDAHRAPLKSVQHACRLLIVAALLASGAAQIACSGADSTDSSAEQAQPEARGSLSFGYIHELEDIPEGGPVKLRTEDGAEIEITAAYLVISGIEVHLCEPGSEESKPSDERGSLWPLKPAIDLLIPQAFAHVPSSATRLGTPFVEDLLEPGRARVIDEIAPPLASYCAFFAIIAPADDDVVNLSGLERAEIEGKSLLIQGRWRPDEGAEWAEFRSTSAARDLVELAAEDPQTGAAPLKLSADDNSRMVLLDKLVSPELFAGLAPDTLEGPAAAELVLDALKTRLKIYRFED